MGIFFKGKKQRREKELVQAAIKEEVQLAEMEEDDEYYDPDDEYFDPGDEYFDPEEEDEYEPEENLEEEFDDGDYSEDSVENTNFYNDEDDISLKQNQGNENFKAKEAVIEDAETSETIEGALEPVSSSESVADNKEFDSEELLESILDEYFGVENTSEEDVSALSEEKKQKDMTEVSSVDDEQEKLENVSESEIIDEESEVIESEVIKEDIMDKIIEQNVMTVVEHGSNEVALSKSTGKLEKMLGKHGEDYTKELSKAFESLIEKDPSAAATIFMAATVATLQTFDGDTDKMAEELDIDDRDISMAEYEFHARYKKQQ